MSDVILLNRHTPNIAIVQLLDRESGNTFSIPFIQGITEVFAQIAQDSQIKVVVVHGYDNYFCCGGTKEELLKLQQGEGDFTELGFYRLLLDCKVPVIAAMQGHGLGGGLAFGCYADFIIMAEESMYATNFMKYGFTPGMGSTYIIPKKLGMLIGNEMLLSAKYFFGKDLKGRGIASLVLPRKDVVSTALTMAQELADKPRESLMILKNHLNSQILEELPSIIKKEVAMHQITFALPEVRQRIENLYRN